MAAVLQRSVTSFRRQGSSGLVWDERFFSGEVDLTIMQRPNEEHDKDGKHVGLRQSHSDGSIRMRRCPTRVEGARAPVPPRVTAERLTPSSLKIGGGCGFFGIFSRPRG